MSEDEEPEFVEMMSEEDTIMSEPEFVSSDDEEERPRRRRRRTSSSTPSRSEHRFHVADCLN